MRMMTVRNLMIAFRIVHAVGLSSSNQLMISNQNTCVSSELTFANHLEKEKSGYKYLSIHRQEKQVPNLILKDSRQRHDGSSCKLRTCLEAGWTITTRNLGEVCYQWSWCRMARAPLLCHVVCPKIMPRMRDSHTRWPTRVLQMGDDAAVASLSIGR